MYMLYVRCMCVYLECTVSICAIISIWVFVDYDHMHVRMYVCDKDVNKPNNYREHSNITKLLQ